MAKQKPQAPQKPARAPTRRVPPPKPPQKSGTPVVLIIFLVFFILISLVLGVFLYLAQDKIDTAQKTAKDKEAEASKWREAERLERQYFTQKLRMWYDNVGADAQELRTLADFEQLTFSDPGKDPRNDADHKWFPGLQKAMEGDPSGRDADAKKGFLGPYDGQNGKTATCMKELLDNLKKQVATVTTNFKEEQDKLNKKIKEFDDYKKEYNRDVVDAAEKKVRNDYERQIKARLEEKDKTIAEMTKKMEEVTRDFEKNLADMTKAQKAELAKRDDEVKVKKQELDVERAELKQRQTRAEQFALDEIRGHVLRADGGNDTVYIDIGSNHRVNPGLKFSVRGVGPGSKPDKEPKAMIEVISVVGPSVSLARVTRVAKPEFARSGRDPATNKTIDPTSELFWITDPKQFWNSRTPVVAGDVLFNPLWNPKEPVHVVLAGFFDLDGDGNDDLDFFRRHLTDAGVQIDGYLDPNTENQLRGKLDYQTDYLIVGGLPLLETGPSAAPLAEQVKGASGGPTGKAVAALNQQAVEKGVAVVRLKDFLARMGFTTLRLPNPRTNTGTPAPAAGNGAPAEEKKEERE
jgi:hypothetical protein